MGYLKRKTFEQLYSRFYLAEYQQNIAERRKSDKGHIINKRALTLVRKRRQTT